MSFGLAADTYLQETWPSHCAEFNQEYLRFEFFGDDVRRNAVLNMNNTSNEECGECRQSSSFDQCIANKTAEKKAAYQQNLGTLVKNALQWEQVESKETEAAQKLEQKLTDLIKDCPTLNHDFMNAGPVDFLEWNYQNNTNKCVEKSLCEKEHDYLKNKEECAKQVKQAIEVNDQAGNLAKNIVEASTINFGQKPFTRADRDQWIKQKEALLAKTDSDFIKGVGSFVDATGIVSLFENEKDKCSDLNLFTKERPLICFKNVGYSTPLELDRFIGVGDFDEQLEGTSLNSMAGDFLTRKILNIYGPLLIQNIGLHSAQCDAGEKRVKAALREEIMSEIRSDLVHNGQFMNSLKFKNINEFKSCINSMGLEEGLFNKFIADMVNLAYAKNCGKQGDQNTCGGTERGKNVSGEIRQNKIDQQQNLILAMNSFGQAQIDIDILDSRISALEYKCMPRNGYNPSEAEKLFCVQAEAGIAELKTRKLGVEEFALEIVSKYPEVAQEIKMKSGRGHQKTAESYSHYATVTGNDQVFEATLDLAASWENSNLEEVDGIKNSEEAKELMQKILQPFPPQSDEFKDDYADLAKAQKRKEKILKSDSSLREGRAFQKRLERVVEATHANRKRSVLKVLFSDNSLGSLCEDPNFTQLILAKRPDLMQEFKTQFNHPQEHTDLVMCRYMKNINQRLKDEEGVAFAKNVAIMATIALVNPLAAGEKMVAVAGLSSAAVGLGLSLDAFNHSYDTLKIEQQLSNACLPDVLAREQAENALWWNTVLLGVDLFFTGLATPHMVKSLQRAKVAGPGKRLTNLERPPLTDREMAYQAKELQALMDKLDNPHASRSSLLKRFKSAAKDQMMKRALGKVRKVTRRKYGLKDVADDVVDEVIGLESHGLTEYQINKLLKQAKICQ